MLLSWHSVGTYQEISSQVTQPQLSQLAKPLRTDPGLESGISVRKLISTTKKKKEKEQKKAQSGIEWSILPQK